MSAAGNRRRAVLAFPLGEAFELTPEVQEALALFSLEVVRDPGSRAAALGRGDVLVTGTKGIHGQVATPMDFVRAMPELRWVHSVTAGVESLVDVEIARRDILVTTSAGAYAQSMAEYAFAALVLLTRRIPGLLVASHGHAWNDAYELGGEVGGKLVGIVGYGGIGRRLAQICVGAGARVWGLRRRPHAGERGEAERVLGPDGLHELLRHSDMLVVAASMNPSSRGLIGERELRLLKRGSLVVSVSRGGILQEDALRRALLDGHLAGAMLDVTEHEPLPSDSPLWDTPNLWITPHMSGRSRESRPRVLELLATNLRAYATGDLDRMCNVVDVERELDGTVDQPADGTDAPLRSSAA